MRGADYWELMGFLMVAEDKSFRRAAERLGVAPSSLSHTIRALEEKIGTRLLHRTTRSVALTDRGELLRERLSPAFAEIEAAVSATRDSVDQAVGKLRLTTPRVGAEMVLYPILGTFLRDHPMISAEVFVDEAQFDSVAAGFDAGLRIMEDIERGMTAVPIGGELCAILVASPDYLDRAGWPKTPEDLFRHRWLNYKAVPSGRAMPWEFLRDGDERTISIEGPLTTNDAALTIAAARDGAGLAFVTEGTVDDLLASGELVVAMKDWKAPFPGWALYYPTGRLLTPPMKVFLDYLAEHFAKGTAVIR